jgi:hypothetical protein
MKTYLLVLVALTIFIFPNTALAQPQAIPGSPKSGKTGIGAHLDLDGNDIPQALRTANILRVDWVSLDFDWAANWPDINGQPVLDRLDNAMQLAAQNKLVILLRLMDAPGWARNISGPDPDRTAWFISNLVKRYPGIIQAVELFPAANTESGWGNEPKPDVYAHFFQSVAAAVKETGIFVVGPGLSPLPAVNPSSHDIDDLVFLQGLYDAGAAAFMPVVSMCLPVTYGDPLTSPAGNEHRVLRHYEEIHQVMLSNNHKEGLIWITQFNLPMSFQNGSNDVSLENNPLAQEEWLSQAYHQLRSQLYLGMASLININSPSANPPENAITASLLDANLKRNPTYQALKDVILDNNPAKVKILNFNKPQNKQITKSPGSP